LDERVEHPDSTTSTLTTSSFFSSDSTELTDRGEQESACSGISKKQGKPGFDLVEIDIGNEDPASGRKKSVTVEKGEMEESERAGV
jgi:hypothetical protein